MLAWLVVAALYAVLAVQTFRMLEVVHDEKSPILQIPGSVTYGCVMGGMAHARGAGAALGLARVADQPSSRAERGEPHVPQAHW